MKPKKTIDESQAFETAIAAQLASQHYSLRPFVTGTTPRAARAIRSIRDICEQQLQGRYDLEVIDIYQHPEQARPEQIVVAPTLVKSLPLPVRRLIGDLSDQQRVLVGLNIVPREPVGENLP